MIVNHCNRWLKQQLSNANAELDLLQGDHPTHPEYLAQMRCIDKRSDEKVHYENVLLEFDKKALRTRTVAERCTHHSQFFQEVREIKDKALETCWKEYFALQKDRRSWGADTSDYTMLYNPSRSVQIHQQRARNLEVSILSGIAKHVGFPGAPVINGLSAIDVEQDLSIMGVSASNSNSVVTVLIAADAEEYGSLHQSNVLPVRGKPRRCNSRCAIFAAESVGKSPASSSRSRSIHSTS